MRIRLSKFLTLCIVLVNLTIFIVSWKYFLSSDTLVKSTETKSIIQETTTAKPRDRIQEANKHLRKSLTIVFRDFFHFDNDLKSSIDHLLTLIPNLRILIVYDEIPYPPLNIFSSASGAPFNNQTSTLTYRNNVQFTELNADFNKVNPLNLIQTKYVLFMPDSFRLVNGRQFFQRLIKSLGSSVRDKEQRKVIVTPFTSNKRLINYCFLLNIDLPNWTIEYEVKNDTKSCNMYTQKHALLLETVLLNELPEPFASPFPEYFYIQAKFANIQLQYSNETFLDGKKLMSSYHSKTRRKSIKKDQFKALYKKLQFKKVVKKYYYVPQQKSHQKNPKNKKGNANAKDKGKDKSQKGGKENKDIIDVLIEPLEFPATVLTNQSAGASMTLKTDVSFYGCEKNTKSCIGQIFNEKPFYLYLNKKTPPCCLEKLKTVFAYVVEELINTGIRYWLDNVALKNAIELNSLSNDAYEIDISFNANDYNRSNALKRCSESRPYTDLAGFFWQQATDGQYFKIQFSKANDIHVNLLPFEIQNDKMVPKGFYGPKAKEFSIEYLHPMSTVFFLGKNVFCPNNVREYLEMKNLK